MLHSILEKEQTSELIILPKQSVNGKNKSKKTHVLITEEEVSLTTSRRKGIYISKIDISSMTFFEHTPSMGIDEFQKKDDSFIDEFEQMIDQILAQVEAGTFVLMKKK